MLGTDGLGTEGGQPAVIGSGPDRSPGPRGIDEHGALQSAEAVLQNTLGQCAELDELARCEHSVFTEQAEQQLVGREEGSGAMLVLRAGRWNGRGQPVARTRQTTS